MKIQDYMQDGANYQARAVLMALQGAISDGIESSWNEKLGEYESRIDVARWYNCREQGYVATLCFHFGGKGHQLNIAWFEHRNSDSIHAVKWEQFTTNPPTIENADFGGVYTTKWDTSFSVEGGKYEEAAKWIKDQFVEFWDISHKLPTD